ncbi:hypothetical protein PAAG_11264 [Paracoccidioides lutzii Pb01]|uniref:Uncharacterized protein n=1 Tax=Paracoccidioides lutzii (strain ATCC MYA-826 / Pb01) TaxID=502779 RepID=A0A0A2V248_PARBA|nr:hypothetical protein PAAG_11264 [Paracoccidioides lutzii Pb01]KGQ01876.1 hypothetical protein PAAG_11264 [Paracoccidioides lutzii Pb01]
MASYIPSPSTWKKPMLFQGVSRYEVAISSVGPPPERFFLKANSTGAHWKMLVTTDLAMNAAMANPIKTQHEIKNHPPDKYLPVEEKDADFYEADDDLI